MAGLQIKMCESVTPRQLVELHRGGRAVYRTAHVGNQYLSNLLLASIGLPLYLYDKNVLAKDQNYHPAVQITGGKRQELTSPTHTLVPYAEFSDHPLCHKGTPANLHYRTLKQLFGNLVFTEAELFLRYEERLSEIFFIIASHNPGLLDRYVFPCGCMERISRFKEDEIQALASCRHHRKEWLRTSLVPDVLTQEAIGLLHELRDLVLNPERRKYTGGVVPSLELTQLICLLVGWWESGHPEIYELSGPDMIKYAPDPMFIEKLIHAFSLIEKYGNPRLLPGHDLVMQLVPTADFRFGYVEGDEKSELVLKLHQAILSTQGSKRDLLRSSQEERWQISAAFDLILNALAKILRGHMEQWDIFYEIHGGKFFSHHDLLPDKKLIVPDMFLDMPFGTMKVWLHRLRQVEQSLLSKI